MKEKLLKLCEDKGFALKEINKYQFRILKGTTKILDIWDGRYSFKYFPDNKQYYFCFIHWLKQLELLLDAINNGGSLNISDIFMTVPFKVPKKSGFWSYDKSNLMIGYSASWGEEEAFKSKYYKSLKQSL
ncbi:hypothetical protein G7050_02555 [Dysgonomonas sp. HDW5A]|uniref:hypothetical protein n=1 Tax=Dysgonomonas sp. HDW5A TaxID=2714926 RepID=UPI001407D410|nr:hypothetical protein [Dysgonomonas sp. HDW5A]QIK58780.1 hypothetical protein G7050_02555 [Dysgonomonas sp. HDW5A]